MKPIRTGVIGVGRLGREHARILATTGGAELVGVHDRHPRRGERVAAELGTRHFADQKSLLGAADAVVVAVPTPEHHPVTRNALLAGCHALVEKPLAASLEEADDLISLAESAGVRLAVGHVERFNDAIRACLPHLEAPRFIESLRLAPFRRRGTEVPVVLDLMIHDIDLVLRLVRSPVERVQAVGTPVLTDSVDIANARLQFENGGVAEITASRVSEEPMRTLRIFQPDGYFRLDLSSGRGELLRRRADGLSTALQSDERGSGALSLDDFVERIPLGGEGLEPLRLEVEAFLGEVRGERSQLGSASEARSALEVAFRIIEEVDRFAHVALETA